jgi:hypothetical protein
MNSWQGCNKFKKIDVAQISPGSRESKATRKQKSFEKMEVWLTLPKMEVWRTPYRVTDWSFNCCARPFEIYPRLVAKKALDSCMDYVILFASFPVLSLASQKFKKKRHLCSTLSNFFRRFG